MTSPKKIIVGILFAAAVASIALGWYFAHKPEQTPEKERVATPSTAHPAASTSAMPTQKVDSVDAMTERLRARLEKEPSDVDGWVLLGRSYHYLERWDDAKAAFAKARALGYQGDADAGTSNASEGAAVHGSRGGDAVFNDIGRIGVSSAEREHAATNDGVEP